MKLEINQRCIVDVHTWECR